ncbi:MAG TPA: Crp/Fnr family transcriptional regulator [Coriobacteriia bacterium]|nr:Crp/Fnr family transcriptional regulator [Coriobacteriia bacterium]
MFGALTEADMALVAAAVRVRKYARGAFVILRGEQATCFYLLTSGRAKLTIASPDGKELVLGHLCAPAHFGEGGLGGHAYLSDVVAVTDIELMALGTRELGELVRAHPAVAVALIDGLSQQLRETVGRLEDLTFRDATHRVMRVLLNVATARFDSVGFPLIQGLTHYDIATLAGTSRETASRVISALSKDGVIESKGRSLLIDVERLKTELGAGVARAS